MALGRNHKIFNIGNASGTIQGLTRVYHDLTLSGDGTLSSLLGVVGGQADEEVNQYVYDNSATIDEVNTSYQTNSGNFLTAIPDYYATTGDLNDLEQSISETYQVKGDYVERNVMDSAIESATSGKLDASSFASVSGDFLVASSLNGYATESFVEETSGAITSLIPTDYYPNTNPSSFVNEDWVTAQGYITGVDLTPYQPKSGMIDYQTTAGMTAYATTGDVANKLDTTAFSNVSSTFLTAHQEIPSAKWENASDVVESNSAQWGENTGDEEVNNAVYNNSAKWNDISVYQSNSSTYLTAHQDISNKLDTTAFSEVSGDFLTTAFEISQSAKWEEASNAYEQNSGTYLTAISIPESATWNDVSTTVQTNSADWASHQDLTYISAQVDNKLDTTAFSDVSGSFLTAVSIPESADWSETTDVVQTNSGKWNDITAYQNASAGYLTAHQDLSNYYTKSETSGADELANAFANIPAGDSEVNSYVHDTSATIDEVNSTVQSNSASWGQGGGVTYSAGEYIDITDDTISVTGVTDLVAGNAITITTSGTSAIISSNGEAQVQSDWDVTDSNSKAYIKNKPTIPAAQIQSDWNQTNTNAKDYIKNKPSIPSYTGASGINVSSNIVSLDNPIGLVAGDNITITVSGTSAILSANAGGGGGSTSGLVSGTNVVKVPDWEGDNFGDYWSACISGDVKVATGTYDETDIYERSVYSLSAIGSDIGNKLNKNTIENSKTIRSNNNVYEVFDIAYKRTNFTNGSASNINLDDDASIEFDAADVVRASNLYSATIIAETTATGEIETENGGIWKIADFSNGSAILTATYLAGIRSDIIDLYTWEGWGPITNCEATCTVYTSAELAPLAYKDDIPKINFVSTSSEATGTNILYVVTGTGGN
jgi:hypothetical protein